MKITFSWIDENRTQHVDTESDQIPRVGEQVSINIQITKEDWVRTQKRVDDVIWNIGREPSVILLCS